MECSRDGALPGDRQEFAAGARSIGVATSDTEAAPTLNADGTQKMHSTVAYLRDTEAILRDMLAVLSRHASVKHGPTSVRPYPSGLRPGIREVPKHTNVPTADQGFTKYEINQCVRGTSVAIPFIGCWWPKRRTCGIQTETGPRTESQSVTRRTKRTSLRASLSMLGLRERATGQ